MSAKTLFLTTGLMIFAISAANAATLLVDINGGAGPTQSGWQGFTPTGPATYTNAFGGGESVIVTVSQGPLPADVRNRNRGGTITGTYASLSNVLTDFYGSRQIGDVVTLTLSLAAGTYDFLSYHHDSENSTIVQSITASTVLNANVTNISNQTSSFTMTSGRNELPSIATYSTRFTLLAAGDVQFQLTKTNGSGEFGFNGFELTLVPEPSALALCGAGFATLVLRRRRLA